MSKRRFFACLAPGARLRRRVAGGLTVLSAGFALVAPAQAAAHPADPSGAQVAFRHPAPQVLEAAQAAGENAKGGFCLVTPYMSKSPTAQLGGFHCDGAEA